MRRTRPRATRLLPIPNLGSLMVAARLAIARAIALAIALAIGLASGLATPATAGQWVVSPHPETLSGYYQAGGDVAAHVTASGDRLLFFDT